MQGSRTEGDAGVEYQQQEWSRKYMISKLVLLHASGMFSPFALSTVSCVRPAERERVGRGTVPDFRTQPNTVFAIRVFVLNN